MWGREEDLSLAALGAQRSASAIVTRVARSIIVSAVNQRHERQKH